jgi:hypothetical protein
MIDPGEARAALEAVASALRPLHRSLVEVTRLEYEAQHGRVPGPGALFNLLVRDPFFAWLRPMSGLMAQLDEVLDDQVPIGGSHVAQMRAQLETLVTEGEHPFAVRYLDILQAHPEVVMAHAALRRALDRLTIDRRE